jgi:hypothetical protein
MADDATQPTPTHAPLQGALSFKKNPRSTGLAAIADPYPTTQIKIGGREVGLISPPRPRGSENWSLRFMVKDASESCGWRWIGLRGRYETEEQARSSLFSMDDKVRRLYDLYQQET